MTGKRAIMHWVDATLTADVKIENVSLWCRVNGVDRRTFYRHRDRIRAEGRWEPRSRRPHTIPHATPPRVEAEIVALRASLAPDNGADFIRDALQVIAERQDWAGQGVRVPARGTINRILHRHRLLEANPRKRPRTAWRRFTYARPRDCYQIDATEVGLATGDTVVVFDVIDDHSRMLVACHAAPRETTDAAITAITTAFTQHGVPAIVLSDNGAAFTGRHRHTNAGPTRFAHTVTTAGARLIHSSPYHPQTCGKVERHHQTLKKWLAHQPEQPTTLTELHALLDTYRDHYNTQRPHSALHRRRTPAHTWDNAPSYGGPHQLPLQTDATIHRLRVSRAGTVNLGKQARIRIGTDHATTTITIIRDTNRVTAYTANGEPIGHLHLDTTKTYQGALIPAA
jgi:transposase InsO family protein